MKKFKKLTKEAAELIKELIVHAEITPQDCMFNQAGGRFWMDYKYPYGFCCVELELDQWRVIHSKPGRT